MSMKKKLIGLALVPLLFVAMVVFECAVNPSGLVAQTTYRILVRSGLRANLPTLSAAEFGFATDTREVFIGSSVGNIPLQHYITPEQYGAVGNGTTDDTTAIQAAIDAIKALSGSKDKFGTLVLSPGKIYKYTSSLDLTNCGRILLDGYGASLKSFGLNGKAGIDLLGSKDITFRHVVFDSDSTNPPGCHILQGRSTDAGGENSINNRYSDCFFTGYWTIAGVYSVSSELSLFDGTRIYCLGPGTAKYGLFQSGHNDESMTSDYATMSATVSAYMMTLIRVDITCVGTASMIPFYFSDASIAMYDCYAACYGVPAIKTYGTIDELNLVLGIEGTPTNAIYSTARGGASTVSNVSLWVGATPSGDYIWTDANTTYQFLTIDKYCARASATMTFGTLQDSQILNWTNVNAGGITCVNCYESTIYLRGTMTLTVSGTKRNVIERHHGTTPLLTVGMGISIPNKTKISSKTAGGTDSDLIALWDDDFLYIGSAQNDIVLRGNSLYGAEKMRIDQYGNLHVGPNYSVGTSAAKAVYVESGATAPSTSPADKFALYSADAGAVAGQAGPHFRTEGGGIFGMRSDTGTTLQYVYQADALADDGTVTLPDATSGMVLVSCNAEAGMWLVQADGTVTKISGSTNTAAADTDANLCVYDGGTGAIVKNRLGATGEIRVIFYYN